MNPKGKGIDPQEWGNVNISCESLDLEAQAVALNSFKPQSSRHAEGKHHQHRKDSQDHKQQHGERLLARKHGKHSAYPAESQPVAQIAPKSYLGAALKNIEQSENEGPPSGSSSGLSSSSDSSSSTSSSMDDSTQYQSGLDSETNDSEFSH